MSEVAIAFSEQARDWIQRHGGSVMLRASTRHGCCGGSADVPVVDLGEPADPAGYHCGTHQGVQVYLDRNLSVERPLSVRLEGFLGFRRLFVDGMALSAGHNE